MKFDFDFEGDQQISRTLVRFSDRSSDMRPVFRALADDFTEMEERQFNTEGGFASGGWRPLAQVTLDRKAIMGLDLRRLHATHALRDSLTFRNDPNHVRRITADSLFVGTAIDYAVHHQHGAPRANLPRRRPVEFREQDRRRWVKAIQRYLLSGRVIV